MSGYKQRGWLRVIGTQYAFDATWLGLGLMWFSLVFDSIESAFHFSFPCSISFHMLCIALVAYMCIKWARNGVRWDGEKVRGHYSNWKIRKPRAEWKESIFYKHIPLEKRDRRIKTGSKSQSVGEFWVVVASM